MQRKTRRIATLVVGLLVVGAMLVATASAAAAEIQIHYTFKNWSVWGSLTPKKLNEPITLPPESFFNGTGTLVSTESAISGTVTGSITVPPFNAALTVLGIPTSVGATFTEVGPAEGSIVQVPAAECAGSHFGGTCVTLSVNTKVDVGITSLGIPGLIDIPTHCEITEPALLPLKTTLPLEQLLTEGSHFTGSTVIPPINCGISGLLLSPLLTALMSGPENSYSLHIGPNAPAAPTVVTQEAASVSQISADLRGTSDPDGEPESDCHFEYGTSTSYGSSIPCQWAPGSGFAVHAAITGLAEGTLYHYRLVASDPLGTGYGKDQTFTTLSGAPEYGQCVAEKHSRYADSGCLHLAEKKGVPDGKGSFEWMPGPSPTCVARKKGEYTDAACTQKAVKAGKGSYEKEPGPGYTFSSGAVTLQTPGLGRTVTCAAGTGSGEVTGLSASADRVTFTGCEASGKKCASEGPNSTPSGKAGVIVTNLLRNRLLGPVLGDVWTELVGSQHEPYSSEFGCEGPRFRTKGSLAGIQSGDIETMSLTSMTTFNLNDGEQALSTELSENGGKSWTGPDPSSEVAAFANASAAAIEIRP
jgi:hypothetical protein